MENFTLPWFKPGLDEGKLMIAVRPDTPLQMIAVDDIGDELTMPEAARVLGKAMSRKVEFVPVPIEDVRKGSADDAIMYDWFDRVGYDVHIRSRSRECGIPPTSLEAWAAKAR